LVEAGKYAEAESLAKEILSELDAAGQAKSKPAAEAVAIMLAAYSHQGRYHDPMPRRPPTA